MSSDIAPVIGTSSNDRLIGSNNDDLMIGLAGDDTIDGASGNDEIVGDYAGANLLAVPIDALSLGDLATSDDWTAQAIPGGETAVTQVLSTTAGQAYTLSLDIAANLASGKASGTIIVFWNGAEIAQIDTSSAEFANQQVNLVGTGGNDQLTLQSAPSSDANGPTTLFDTAVPSYETIFTIAGEDISVRAFAPGQANFYQVLGSTLHTFDPAAAEYTAIGSAAGHVYNGMGFNVEDNLLYAIATKAGADALGQTVSKSDLVMIDATGSTYRLGEAPYASWVGDFDGQGNLWTFDSDMDHIARVDVSEIGTDSDEAATIFKFPKSMVTEKVLDVAYNASTQQFMGVARPANEGDIGTLLIVDVSSGAPTFSRIEIRYTLSGDMVQVGIPKMTFGAAFIDVDGNLYVGGNNGDHDMDDGTPNSGGIYRVEIDNAAGSAHLVLVSDAQGVGNNDGAADPRAISGTTVIDQDAPVLIRQLSLVEAEDPALSYDDLLHGEAGADTVAGGLGVDQVVGGSLGDHLFGGAESDNLYGGAGPNFGSAVVSTYDDLGLRYDQFGNLLPEDDDVLQGGDGDDVLDGSAGHDVLFGGEGDDLLKGGSGLDVLYGADGFDDFFGGSENDSLFGGGGDDGLSGGSGDDHLEGGLGADSLNGGSGSDALRGGADDDALLGGSGHDALDGGDGDDVIEGGSGNDTIDGGFGADDLRGGSGADVLDGGYGHDALDGGSGDDVVTAGDGNDRAKGGSGDDTVDGGTGKDYLSGGGGDDALDGGSGRDALRGGTGADVMTGGLGDDRFLFRLDDMDGSLDTITDLTRYGSAMDTIDVSDLNLLSGGQTREEWAAENLSQAADFTVTLDLGTGTLLLTDSEDLQDGFADTVLSSLVF